MFDIILTIVVILVEVFAPSYISIIVAIADVLIPDSIPLIDEAVGIGIVVSRLKS